MKVKVTATYSLTSFDLIFGNNKGKITVTGKKGGVQNSFFSSIVGVC